MRPGVSILNVRIDDVTFDSASVLVEEWIDAGRTCQIATVNPEFIMRAREDSDFAATLAHTDLNAPDGVGVVWAARRQGTALRERVGGTDLMVELCRLASRRQWRVYLLGAQEGVAERAAGLLAARFPGLRVAGTFSGSPRVEDQASVVARIQRARAQLLFVAFGAPAQDLWIARNLRQFGAPAADARAPGAPESVAGLGFVAMGVGGAFDFIAGVQKRAPEWMQRIGLEWAYRLARDPRRIRRQMSIPRFMWRVMLESPRPHAEE